jgi:hypothetical protein
MKSQLNQQVFMALMTKLNIQAPKSEKENFNEWMKTKVKSIHFANNQAMLNAYNKIEEKTS